MLHQQSSTSHGLAKRAEKQFTATQVAAGTGQQGEEQQKRVGESEGLLPPSSLLAIARIACLLAVGQHVGLRQEKREAVR